MLDNGRKGERGHRGLVLLLALAVGSGCELQERPVREDFEPLPPARAIPPEVLRERMGPVFAPPAEAPLVVADEFWAGAGTVGYELVGEFLSREALRTSLDPGLPIGRYHEREWYLSEILVAVDYRVPGEVVIWRVAGPPEVVTPYVERLQEGVDERSPLHELGVLPLDVVHCCLEPPEDPGL